MKYHINATLGVFKNNTLVYHNQHSITAIEKHYYLVLESSIYNKVEIRFTHEY